MRRAPHQSAPRFRRRAPRRFFRARAFTLLELVVAITIMGILAVSVVPALGAVTQSRRAAAARELQRRLELARARSIATGRPYALRVSGSTISELCISASGAAPAPISTPAGGPAQPFSLDELFPGVAVTSFTNPNSGGGGDTSTIWFANDGRPQLRSSAGAFVKSFTSSATITITAGSTVAVTPVGAVTISIAP